MKIAIITSNSVSVRSDAKKGTEIFDHIFINHLAKNAQKNNLQITAFASGDSDLQIPIESVNYLASFFDKNIPKEKYIIFELALLSKAFTKQEEFDLYHINIGDGDIALPFLPFVKKPVLITLHNTASENYVKDYFSLFKDLPNAFFIPISNVQKKLFPSLNFIKTIYHGIDTKNFPFSLKGGQDITWAGRGMPQKGMDIVIEIANSLQKKAHLFALVKNEYQNWLDHQIEKISKTSQENKPSIYLNTDRSKLADYFRNSKLFLFPIIWEEPFGLVLVEAMACGTPVIAFARGSTPEIVKDGETGFLINPSEDDIRGEFVIKKTGIEGLKEAVERIYAMREKEYLAIRRKCREHVEKYFTVERMTDEYLDVYKEIITNQKK